MARYDELLRWAERMCDGQVHDAEDLLQDAFIEFVRRRPPLEDIQDLDAYLRQMLRNMHVSEIRRSQSLKRGGRSCVDFDCLERAVAGIDPRSAWDRRVELELLCRYACARKETSKSASVLILRFFHDLLPSEIARLMRSNRRAVDEWLRLARAEARQYLQHPVALDSADAVTVAVDSPVGNDLAAHLRRTVFAHRTGACLSPREMRALYAPANGETLDHATLSHLVSCPDCLSSATRAAGVERSEDRQPPAEGGGEGADVFPLRPAGRKDRIRAALRRGFMRVEEQRPTELVIAANGFEISSQVVQPGHNEHTVRPNIGAEIGFVELFSENGTRLVYLEVQPPPTGAVEQGAEYTTGDGRRVSLRVRFDQPWPEIQASYDDPETEAAPLPEFTEAETERRAGGFRGWLRPAFALAGLAIVLSLAGLWVRRQRNEAPTLSAATQIRDAEANERTLSSRRDRIAHRVLQFEDRRKGSAAILRRYRIETWQDAERHAEARRVYDEKGAPVAGEWVSDGNPITIFDRGAQPEVFVEPVEPETEQLLLRRVSYAPWRFSPSAAEFRTLIGSYLRQATYELTSLDGEPVYLLRAVCRQGPVEAAALLLAKADLHPLQAVLFVRTRDGLHEYRYRERGFALLDRSSLPDIFRPQARSARPERNFPPSESPPLGAGDRVEVEAEAWYRMHQAGACTGEQAGIGWMPDGRLEVRAVVSDEARKKELLGVLEPLRGKAAVDFSVLVVGEGGAGSSETRPATTDAAMTRAKQEALVRMPAYGLLKARLGGDARIADYADAVVSSSDRALAQVWALVQLAEWAESRRLESVSGRARTEAQEMLRSHARDFRRSVASLRTLLERIAPADAQAAARPETGAESTPIEEARTLLRSVSAQNAAVHAAFVPSAEIQTAAEMPDAGWATSLIMSERRASWIEQHGLGEALAASASGRKR